MEESGVNTESAETVQGQKVLHINPLILYFPPPLNRIITNILKLQNTSNNHYVAYKVKTTRPNRYCVRPNLGLINPGETIELQIHFSFQKDPPQSLRSKDKFQVESILLTEPLGHDQHLSELFKTTPTEKIMKEKLKCRFASPTPTPSERMAEHPGSSGSEGGNVEVPSREPDKKVITKPTLPEPWKAKPSNVADLKASQELSTLTKDRDKLKNKVIELQANLDRVSNTRTRDLLLCLIVFIAAFTLGYNEFLILAALIVCSIIGVLAVPYLMKPKTKTH